MEMEVKLQNETDSVPGIKGSKDVFQIKPTTDSVPGIKGSKDGSLIKPILGETFKQLPQPKEEVRLLASPAIQNWERLLGASRRKEEVGTSRQTIKQSGAPKNLLLLQPTRRFLILKVQPF